MARPDQPIAVEAEPSKEVLYAATVRKEAADGDAPIEEFLLDHVQFEIEWLLPDVVELEDRPQVEY